MYNFIPLSVPNISDDEWNYVKDCFDTGWVSSAGKYVNIFEEKIAEYTGAKYAIACINGTSALHISLIVSGVKENDEVLVPTLTFIAPINAVKYVNANPIFFDCDEYYNIDSEKVINFIMNNTEFKSGYSYNKNTKKRISAIIPVHIFGNAVNIERLVEICEERNIKIIEDATESLGTFYSKGKVKGKHTGTIGMAGCLSFNGNKIITTGSGGMILTNDEELAKQSKYLTTQAKDDEEKYIHNNIGYNYRLNNIQAALGIAQLKSLDKFIEAKKNNYNYYKEKIKNIDGLYLADVPDYANNNYWMYGLQVDDKKYKYTKDELISSLHKAGIQTRPVWYLNHLQKMYKDCENYQIEKSLFLKNISLNLPCSSNLSFKEIDYITNTLKSG